MKRTPVNPVFQFLGTGTPRRPSAEGCGGAARPVPEVGATTRCRKPRTGRTSGTVLGVKLGYACDSQGYLGPF